MMIFGLLLYVLVFLASLTGGFPDAEKKMTALFDGSEQVLGVMEPGEVPEPEPIQAVDTIQSDSVQILPIQSENLMATPTEETARDLTLPNETEAGITAKSFIAYDLTDDEPIYEKEADLQLPIASITKLMSMLTILDLKPDWEAYHKMTAEDKREGGKIYLFPGENVKVKDLFNASLVGSDNVAVIAMIHSLNLTEEQFVTKMNTKALSIGLKDTHFKDATGLSKENVSTARDIVRFAELALKEEMIRKTILIKKLEFDTLEKRKKIIPSTDRLLASSTLKDIEFLGGKTGYNGEAGYCFVGNFKNKHGREIITVVLGSATMTSRFTETEKIVENAYSNKETATDLMNDASQ